jgi:S-methylmethionine-dependent homocysteine/selenocysteine methylase
MTTTEAQDYHSEQIGTFADTAADLVSALTMTYPEEAIGITRAAQAVGMPVVISFTVETDGRLPAGHTLQTAIEETDAATQGAPCYYMINCAHPTHFRDAIDSGAAWLARIRGIRANASTRSHAELDQSETLDDGNPAELAAQYHALMQQLRRLNILGGCCGTDHRHIEAICQSVLPH